MKNCTRPNTDISRGNCMIIGDFKHPGVNWNYLESAADSEAFLLLTHGCFLTQHVLEPTRGDNVHDLVLSSQKELINDLRTVQWINVLKKVARKRFIFGPSSINHFPYKINFSSDM